MFLIGILQNINITASFYGITFKQKPYKTLCNYGSDLLLFLFIGEF